MTLDIAIFVSKLLILPIITGLIGAAIKARLEDKRLFKLHDARRLSGKWVGKITFPSTKDAPQRATFVFDSKKTWQLSYWMNPRIVTGVADVEGDLLKLRGGFCTPDRLMIEYRSTERKKLQFGSVLFALGSGGASLDGYVAGYYDTDFLGRLTLSYVGES